MIPAHFSYAFWMMKSAESSAGRAPFTWAMHSGALSMIPGMRPPLALHAVLADHPLRQAADDRQHQHEAEHEADHRRLPPRLFPRAEQDGLGLDEGAVRLHDPLADTAVLGVEVGVVLGQVQALDLDLRRDAQEVELLEDPRRHPAAEEPERKEREDAHHLAADGALDVVDARWVAGGEHADPEHPEEPGAAVDGVRSDGLVDAHLRLDPRPRVVREHRGEHR